MGFLTQLFSKQTRLSLVLDEGQLLLQCYYDDRIITFPEVLLRWPQVFPLQRFLDQRGAVAVEHLEQVRQTMERLKKRYDTIKLQLDMDPLVQRLTVQAKAPADFRVAFLRCETGLRRRLPEGTRILEGGWFLRGDACWRYDGLPEHALSCLAREEVAFDRLVRFVTDDLPALQRVGIVVDSEIVFNETPALTIELRDVQWDSVCLRPAWHVSPASIETAAALPGCVLAGSEVRPGVALDELRQVLPRVEQEQRLAGPEVAAFLERQYDPWRPLLTGSTALFEETHRWAPTPFQWMVRVHPGDTGSGRRPIAEPMAKIGDDRVSIPELTKAQAAAYWHFPSGWAKQADLLKLGLDGQGLIGGRMASAPFALTAEQFLFRGSAGLDGVWSGLEVTGPAWCEQGGKHVCAAAHLAYLLGWGLNGGLTGGYEAMAAYGVPFLIQRARQNPEEKVLLLGSQEDIQALQQMQADLGPQVCCLPYGRVSRDNRANTTHWDVLILLEPDAYQTASERRPIQEAAKLSARQILGFFGKGPAEASDDQKAWCAALLGYGDAKVLPWLIRDCRAALALPKDHALAKTQPVPSGGRSSGSKQAAGYHVIKSNPKSGVADILLPGAELQHAALASRVERLWKGSAASKDRGGQFLAEARQMADYAPSSAEPVSFECYQPVYADMSARQLEWYFYQRSMWRGGSYPNADLSYVLVHVYELLQCVGAKDPADGYRQLLALWKAYRERLPTLDHLMDGWLSDYVHVYDSNITDAQLLADAPRLSTRALNAALSAMAADAPLRIPLWALEALSGYRATGSKFYQRGNEALMDAAIPGAVAWLDTQCRQKSKKGVLDLYAPLKWHTETVTAFEGTPFAQEKQYALHLHRYENGKKLSDYLRNVIRETENMLRAKRKFSAKLQNVTLDDQTREWIAQYVTTLFEPSATATETHPPKEKITLDLRQLSQLRDESDAVRAALLATTGEPAEDLPEDPAEPSSANVTEEVVANVTEPVIMNVTMNDTEALDDAWQAFFQQADLAALGALLEGEAAFKAYAKARRQMPEVLIDTLNNLSQDTIGDLIIDGWYVTEDYIEMIQSYVRKE